MRLSEWLELQEIREDISQYRLRAIGLLRRYFRMSVEIGRLPSLVGREFFRAKISNYRAHSFEDAVIFVYDMERVLETLHPDLQVIVARIFFQEYSYEETAELLQWSRRTVLRCMVQAIDAITIRLLDCGLLQRTEDPISLYRVNRKKLGRTWRNKQSVSVGLLAELRFPKFCQARKLAKIQLTS